MIWNVTADVPVAAKHLHSAINREQLDVDGEMIVDNALVETK